MIETIIFCTSPFILLITLAYGADKLTKYFKQQQQ
jgi:hypothetical protein